MFRATDFRNSFNVHADKRDAAYLYSGLAGCVLLICKEDWETFRAVFPFSVVELLAVLAIARIIATMLFAALCCMKCR